jgi:phosphoglycerate dehydrogenase-like enzyme
MDPRRIVVTSAWLSPGDEVDRFFLDRGHEVVHKDFDARARTGEGLTDTIADADGVVAGLDAFTADVLRAAPRLKVIARTGVGYDNIDVAAATQLGIPVCATPGANSQAVAEHAVGLMLALARDIPGNVQNVRAGGWDQRSGHELAGRTLGLVGTGAVGKVVARIASAIGMRVIAHDVRQDEAFARQHGVEYVGLEALLRDADVVSLHTVLNAATRGLIGERALSSMKPSAYLVNTSRGGIVDEAALAASIRAGALAGAALDVVEEEPLPASSPLRGLDRVLVTAHVAAATAESRLRSAMMAATSLVEALDGGEPSRVVNPAYLEAHAR